MVDIHKKTAAIAELERGMHDQINIVISDIVKEVNESLAKILKSAIGNAEVLEGFFGNYMSKIKTILGESSNNRERGYDSLGESRNNAVSEKRKTAIDLGINNTHGLKLHNKQDQTD